MIGRTLKKRGLFFSWFIYLTIFSFYALTMMGVWIFRDVDTPLKIACSVFMAIHVLPDIYSDVRSFAKKKKADAHGVNTTG